MFNLSPMKRGKVALSYCQEFLLVEMFLVNKVPSYSKEGVLTISARRGKCHLPVTATFQFSLEYTNNKIPVLNTGSLMQ